MNKRASTPAQVAVIAGFSLSCFALLLFLWLSFGGPVPLAPKGYRFQAAFTDATTLADQADVRIAGVTVGKVVAKRRAPEGNRTLATIELDERFAPIHVDARAILRQKTLLGETYVEMTAGSRHAPMLPEDGRLADTRVEPAVEFDELLRLFDAPTRRAFQQWQRAAAAASGGQARDLNDALGNLPRFVESAGDVTAVLDRRRAALRALVRNTATTFGALSRDEGALRGFVSNTADVLDTLDARRDDLADAFTIFPTFLTESRRTLRRLDRFATDTTPLLRDLRPTLRDGRAALASLRALSPDAKALFEQLPQLVAAGRDGLPALSRVLRGLDPTLAALGRFLQELNPILAYLEVNQSVLGDFVSTGPSALKLKLPTPAGSDSNGHVLPQLIVTGSQSLPAQKRDPDNRGNTYFKAGALADQRLKSSFFIPPNWDCASAGGTHPATDDSPGCFVQDAIPFQGGLTRFPHVGRAAAGGQDPG